MVDSMFLRDLLLELTNKRAVVGQPATLKRITHTLHEPVDIANIRSTDVQRLLEYWGATENPQ